MTNKEKKTALITGITGQDGSFLAELLLQKNYEVYGLVRRLSKPNLENIENILDNITLIDGDLSDQSSVLTAIIKSDPDEIYNLGAQSFVATSWSQAEFTTNVTGLGALRVFEAARQYSPDIKIYQASSSEMYGITDTPQDENTQMNPRSPYGVAKLFAHKMARVYRESYNMFISCGILFNHECLADNTPLILKNKSSDLISIQKVEDIKPLTSEEEHIQQYEINDLEIWDGEAFVDIKAITATKRKLDNNNFICKIFNTRNGIVQVTNHHNMLNEEKEKVKAKEVKIGDKLLHGKYPEINKINNISIEEAYFLGMMVADGYVDEKTGWSRFTKTEKSIINKFSELWNIISGGYITKYQHEGEYGMSTGYDLKGGLEYRKKLRNLLYDNDGYKKVPDIILNSNNEIKYAFLSGYNLCDGLKASLTTYEFKNFKTNSILLAQGLCFLISQTTKQKFNMTFEEDEIHYGYYSINFLTPTDNLEKENKVNELLSQQISQREISRVTGISRKFIKKIQDGGHCCENHHLSKPKTEVKKILCHDYQPEWVYDIETVSGKFMAGVGNLVISNSERRGIEFVSRKITDGVARIKFNIQDNLKLGNLTSRRDWGYAKDYVEAMYLMLQQNKPDDFVIATNENHSVEEFVKLAFQRVDLSWQDFTSTEQELYRPAEIFELKGDYTKAKRILSWKPTTDFNELVNIMIDADLKRYEHKQKY